MNSFLTKILGTITILLIVGCSTTNKNSPYMKFEQSSDYKELSSKTEINLDTDENAKSLFICLAFGSKIVPNALADDILVLGIDDKLVSKLTSNNDAIQVKVLNNKSSSEIRFYFLNYKLIDKNKFRKYEMLNGNRYFIVRSKNNTFDKENIGSTLAYGLMGMANSVVSYEISATNMDEYKEICNIKHRVISQVN